MGKIHVGLIVQLIILAASAPASGVSTLQPLGLGKARVASVIHIIDNPINMPRT